jgi:transcriptional regulator with XRE-family HTH domain
MPHRKPNKHQSEREHRPDPSLLRLSGETGHAQRHDLSQADAQPAPAPHALPPKGHRFRAPQVRLDADHEGGPLPFAPRRRSTRPRRAGAWKVDHAMVERMQLACTGLHIPEIAARTNCTPQSVRRYLRGSSRPSLGFLEALSRATPASLDWLLVGRGPGPDAYPFARLTELTAALDARLATLKRSAHRLVRLSPATIPTRGPGAQLELGPIPGPLTLLPPPPAPLRL